MKRIFTLLLCATLLVLSGCQGRRLQDIKVTSARIVSIVPQGLTELNAVVEVGIHNPSVALEISDIIGNVSEMCKRNRAALMTLSSEEDIIGRTVDLLERYKNGYYG